MRVRHKRSVCILHVAVLRSTAILSFASRGGLCCVLTHLITHLATCSAAPKLSVRLKAVVPIHANDSPIEHGSIESVHGDGGFRPGCILDETETTGLHFDAVQPHNQVYDLTTGGEKLEQLALEREEREVAHVESC